MKGNTVAIVIWMVLALLWVACGVLVLNNIEHDRRAEENEKWLRVYDRIRADEERMWRERTAILFDRALADGSLFGNYDFGPETTATVYDCINLHHRIMNTDAKLEEK